LSRRRRLGIGFGLQKHLVGSGAEEGLISRWIVPVRKIALRKVIVVSMWKIIARSLFRGSNELYVYFE
jgi:hypothetical protein